MEEEGRQLSWGEIVAIARRRFWWVVVPALIGPLVAYGVLLRLTPVYTSQAFVLIEQQKVPDKYVTAVLTDQVDARLATMRDQILSRSRLDPLIQKYGLDKTGVPVEKLVEQLRESVKVTPIRPEGTGVLSGFYVEASANRPQVAQGMCTDVLSMFIDDNLRVRKQRAEDTTSFLEGQLEEAKRKLDQDDAKLADFKRQFLGQLPSDEQTNLQMLGSLTTQLDVVSQALAQAEQQRIYQESLLTQQIAAQSTGGSDSRSAIEAELTRLEQQQRQLESRYTPEHPDVVKVKSQIAGLRAQLAAHKPVVNDAAISSPEVERMRLNLRMVEETVRAKRAEQARLQERIHSFQGRIQLSPAVEAQYKSLTRDYESSSQFYKDLLAKKTQSEMATDLERQQEGEQFRVVDSPSLPIVPSWPRPPKFLATGFALGLALGALMALLQEMRQGVVRSSGDIARHLNLAVLATVPELPEL